MTALNRPERRFEVVRTETVTYSRVFSAEEIAETYAEWLADEGRTAADLTPAMVQDFLHDDYDRLAETIERHGDVTGSEMTVAEVLS